MNPNTFCALVKDSPPTSLSFLLSATNSVGQNTLFGRYKSIVKIDECGVNLEEKVCEWNSDKQASDLCFVFLGDDERDHGMPNGNGKNFCLPGDTIVMFPVGPDNSNREAIVIMNLCACNRCHPEPPRSKKAQMRAYQASDAEADSSDDDNATVNLDSEGESETNTTSTDSAATLPFPSGHHACIQPLNLKSATVTLEFTSRRETAKLTTEFLPGLGFREELGDLLGSHKACRHQIFFYGFIKLKDLSVIYSPEEICKMAAATVNPEGKKYVLPRINILEIKAGKKKFPYGNPVLKRMLEESTLSDFQIIAPSGKEFRCHQAVLSVRSSVFERMLVQQHAGEMRDRGKLHLPKYVTGDDGIEITDVTAEAFLNFVYYGSQTLMRRNIEVACGVMKLAHLYNILDLVAAAAWIIINKLDPQTSNFSDVKLLWKLFSFVRLLDKLQLMCLLKNLIMKALRRCVLQQSSKRTKTENNLGGINALDFMLAGQKEALKEWIMDSIKMGEANDNEEDDSSDEELKLHSLLHNAASFYPQR